MTFKIFLNYISAGPGWDLEVSLNKSKNIVMQMSMYQFCSIHQMRSLFSKLETDAENVDTLHDCSSWVRVPLPAP